MNAYTQDIPGLGQLALAPVEPAADAAILHSWVTMPRNRFWGMGDYSVEDVREVYAYIDGLSTHHAYLIRLDDRPIGLFQTYDPDHDPVGEKYPVQRGDIGLHLLLSPGPRPPRGLVVAIGPALARFLFADPTHQRVVVEPDIRNAFALRRLESYGFTLGDEIQVGEKRAQLAFLDRSRAIITSPATADG